MIDKNDPRLTAFVLNELSESETTEIQSAIEASPELQDAVDEIRSTVAMIETGFANQPELALAADQHSALEREIDVAGDESNEVGKVSKADKSHSQLKAGPKSNSLKRLGWIAGIAASLGLLAIIIVYNGMRQVELSSIANKYNNGEAFQPPKEERIPLQIGGVPNEPRSDIEDADRAARNGLDGEFLSEGEFPIVALEEILPLHNDGIIGSLPPDSRNNSHLTLGGGVSKSAGMDDPFDSSGGENGGGGGFGGGGFGGGQQGQMQQALRRQSGGGGANGDLERALLGDSFSLDGRYGEQSLRGYDEQTARRMLLERALAEKKEQGFWNSMHDTESSSVPFDPAPADNRKSAGEIQPYVSNLSLIVTNDEGKDEKEQQLAAEQVARSFQLSQLESQLSDARKLRDEAKSRFEEGGQQGRGELENAESRLNELDGMVGDLSAVVADKHIELNTLRRESNRLPGQNEGNGDAPATVESALADFDAQFSGSQFGGHEWFFKDVIGGVSIPKTRTETRSRIVQTEEGPKTETYDVEVPYTETPTQAFLKLTEKRAEQLALDFAKRVDPSGTKPIRAVDLIPNLYRRIDPTGSKELQIRQINPDTISVEVVKQAQDFSDQLSLTLKEAQKTLDGKNEDIKVDESIIWKQIEEKLEERNKKIAKKKTWKRVRATPNTSRLMVGEKDELPMNGMQVNVQIEGFRARVLIDCFYYNDRQRQLEGNFKLRLPDDASLYYFAFGQSVYEYSPQGKLAQNEFLGAGEQFVSLRPAEVRRFRQDSWQNVKEARMVPREQAAFAYSQTVRRRVDPALVEWTGGGVFNARVFPLMPRKMHRVVIGYDVDLTLSDDGLAYQLDLPEQTGECVVNLNISEQEGAKYQISPEVEPTQTDGLAISPEQRRELDRMEMQLDQDIRRLGKAHPNVTQLAEKIQRTRMNLVANANEGTSWLNYRFTNPAESSIRLTATGQSNTVLHSNDSEEGNFFATRIKVDLPVEQNEKSNSRAIFLVDTSLSSQPDKFNVWLKMLKATLDNNRGQLKEFAVVFFNVENKFWREEYSENSSDNVKQLIDDCNKLALEGATDLYGAVQRIAMTDWVKSGGSTDLFLLSDGNANWGETNLRLIHRLFENSNFGSLFAYQTGMTGTSVSALRFLAGKTGGAVFSIANEEEIATASKAHRSRPWQLVGISAEHGRDFLTAGRVEWVYPGQMVTLVGRRDGEATEIGPINLKLAQGDQETDLQINAGTQLKSELAGRLFGQVAVGQLENLGQKVFDVSAAYARHFRITGQTCSLLMLETEADYKRFNIVPQDDLIVVNSREVSKLVADVLEKSAAEIADPKAQLLTWVRRLEAIEGMQFKIPTALSLALDAIKVEPISSQLDCSLRNQTDLPEDFRKMLNSGRLDYAAISKESKRRLSSSSDDAIKAISSLIEKNPGDVVMARDVAFTAMELQHPAQAYHLLRRVAESRPYEATIYTALGKCLAQLGQADMAVVFYEIALNAKFQDRGNDFRRITASEYSHLLRKIESGDAKSSIKDYASARMKSLTKKFNLQPADVLVTMMWNTDQTDVDLHVLEPSGEECSYQHTKTRSGGEITRDITTGFGPEMYTLPKAPKGKYSIAAKYFSSNTNRTGLRGKVYITIYHDFGTEDETVALRTVEISDVGQKQPVDAFSVK